MQKVLAAAVIGFSFALLVGGVDAVAGARKDAGSDQSLSQHPKSAYYRHKGQPKVRAYTGRRGGYSYNYADSIDTYGNARTLYGGSNLYRDPMLDRQTNSGPFDHGFFFDSGIGPRGGESPYMH
jgi:hypothetical protein